MKGNAILGEEGIAAHLQRLAAPSSSILCKILFQKRRPGNLRITPHTDKKLKTYLPPGQHSLLYCGGIAGKGQDHLVGMAGSDTGSHVADDLNGSSLDGIVCHDKTDRRGRACHKAEGFAWNCPEGFLKSRACAGRKGELQMPCLADVKLSGIFVGEFERQGDGVAHVRNIIAANDNIVSVAAPALGIAGQVNGQDLCVGSLHCIVNGRNLTGSAGAGAEKAERTVSGSNIHLGEQSIINAGNHQTDGIENRGSDKFCAATVCADAVYIHEKILRKAKNPSWCQLL